VAVLPKLYKAVIFMFYREYALLTKMVFVKCLETEQRNDKRSRYKVSPTQSPAFGSVFIKL
jgi:hypothetical protein